jgi:transposase
VFEKPSFSEQVLAIVGQQYGIERAASDKHLDTPTRQRPRQEEARPILEKLRAYLQEQQVAAFPKSPLGAAISYALRNWVALTRYAEDGRLKIDNNGAEAGAPTDRAWPQKLVVREERSGGAPNRHPVFPRADL